MEQYILQTFGKKKPDLTHKLITTEKKVISIRNSGLVGPAKLKRTGRKVAVQNPVTPFAMIKVAP